MTNEEAIQFLDNIKHEEAGRAIGKDGFYAELMGYHVEALNIAIKALETIPKYKDAYNKGWDDGAKATYEHLKMCEEEQNGDLISRQAVIDAIEDDNRNGHYSCFASNNDAQCFKDVIRSLPSVNQQEPKTGQWIMPVQDDGMSDPIYYQVRCSKCGFDLDPQTWHQELYQYGADKYCPNCGCRMGEPQESDGEE